MGFKMQQVCHRLGRMIDIALQIDHGRSLWKYAGSMPVVEGIGNLLHISVPGAKIDIVTGYGARLELTPGCESNVKEIYDKCHELVAADPARVKIMNQFEVFANYRFHYHVTGNTIVELAQILQKQGLGQGRIAAYVSAMGSGGTIAAGDRLKQQWPGYHKIVGLEPIQCPTLFANGYGAHDIQGIGDKHVTWIHNVMNLDAVMCIDDIETKMGLQLLTEEPGWQVLMDSGIDETTVQRLAKIFGISGVCNVLGAIKTAKYYDLGKNDVIVAVCTDAIDRYHSVMAQMNAAYRPMDATEARVRLVSIFHKQKLDWIMEGTQASRRRWHNLKYYTWVEQQGKRVEALDEQKDQAFWEQQQNRVAEIDKLIEAYRSRDVA